MFTTNASFILFTIDTLVTFSHKHRTFKGQMSDSDSDADVDADADNWTR